MSRDLEALRQLAYRHNVPPPPCSPSYSAAGRGDGGDRGDPSSSSPNRLSAAVARASSVLDSPEKKDANGGTGGGRSSAKGGGINSLVGGAARLGKINARYPSLKRPVGGGGGGNNVGSIFRSNGGGNGGGDEAEENDGSAGNGSPGGVDSGAKEESGSTGSGVRNNSGRSNFSSLVSKFGGSASVRVGGRQGGGGSNNGPRAGGGSRPGGGGYDMEPMSPLGLAPNGASRFGGPPESRGDTAEDGGSAEDAKDATGSGPRPQDSSPFPPSPAVDAFSDFPPDTPDEGNNDTRDESMYTADLTQVLDDALDDAAGRTEVVNNGTEGHGHRGDQDEPDVPDSPIFDASFFEDEPAGAKQSPEAPEEGLRGGAGAGGRQSAAPKPGASSRRLPSLRGSNPVAALAKQARRAGGAVSARSVNARQAVGGTAPPPRPPPSPEKRRVASAPNVGANGHGGEVLSTSHNSRRPGDGNRARTASGGGGVPPSNTQGGMLRAKSRQRQVSTTNKALPYLRSRIILART